MRKNKINKLISVLLAASLLIHVPSYATDTQIINEIADDSIEYQGDVSGSALVETTDITGPVEITSELFCNSVIDGHDVSLTISRENGFDGGMAQIESIDNENEERENSLLAFRLKLYDESGELTCPISLRLQTDVDLTGTKLLYINNEKKEELPYQVMDAYMFSSDGTGDFVFVKNDLVDLESTVEMVEDADPEPVLEIADETAEAVTDITEENVELSVLDEVESVVEDVEPTASPEESHNGDVDFTVESVEEVAEEPAKNILTLEEDLVSAINENVAKTVEAAKSGLASESSVSFVESAPVLAESVSEVLTDSSVLTVTEPDSGASVDFAEPVLTESSAEPVLTESSAEAALTESLAEPALSSATVPVLTESAAEPVLAVAEEVEPEKVFNYENNKVRITATVKESDIAENAELICNEIDEKSERYAELRAQTADFYNVTQDKIDILPYDIGFFVDGEEIEPTGPVSVNWEFKNPIKVKDEEEASFVHMTKNPEILSEDIVSEGQVKKIEVEMNSFSPVVVAKTNVGGMLKSIQKTEGDKVIYISKTSNIKEDGIASSQYSNSTNITDVVDTGGAICVDVTIQFGGEGIGCDWLYIKDANGNILYTDADGKTVGSTNSSSLGKIGGGTATFTGSKSGTKEPAASVNYHFETDTLQFTWRTDSSVTGYGYYAVVTPTYATDPIPDYHFEELEDGTYALVFDKGGDINAFMNRPEIREAVAPYKNSISEIRLHKETTAILNSAFKGLSALKKVTFPRNSRITEIGKNVFADCENLEEITIPASVTTLKPAFNGCSSLKTINFASGSQITELPDNAFSGLTALKNITLPQGITEISKNCFYNCSALTDIDIPEGVTSFKEGAFYNTRLYDVPDLTNITNIEINAFGNCPNLTEVHIPANVTSLGAAFKNCTGITDFVFEEGSTFTTLPADFFRGMSKLTNVTLPENLKSISDRMFYNCSTLEHVTMPTTITSIGTEAFYGCKKLQDFEIPAHINKIGARAFQSCTSLKDMTIPNTVTSIGSGLFAGCSNLIRCIFEEGSPINSLPSEMFSGCNHLEVVKLPDGVTAIPASYFYGCTSLEHVDLPTNLTSIGDNAFYNCYNLEDIVLPNTLKTIGSYAFYNCDKIESVVVPKSVTSIGTYAWNNCSELKTVEFENGSPITSLSYHIFRNCTNLETLVLPSRLTSIPNYLCCDCIKLSNVSMPDTVKTIGSYAFRNCTSLKHIDLPANLTQIYSYAFNGAGLEDIDIPNKVTSIGEYSFQYTQLENVIIPKSVSSISSYAFANNSKLESVIFEPGTGSVNINTYAFANNPVLKEIELREGITKISEYALSNNKRLEEIVIPSTVTTIGHHALYGDTCLRKLTFPASSNNSTLTIGANGSGSTFSQLTNLEELYIDRNITSSYKQQEISGLNPEVKITIGKHVDTLDNMFVSVFGKDSEIIFEGENDFSVSTRITNTSEDSKWQNLKGDFYVDENGVLYKLNKTDMTASVFHIPAGITNYTVPETITSVAGKTYTVNMINSYSVRDAADLTALTVEKPENVIIPQFAFSDSNLETINGQTELFPEDWVSVSSLCDFPVHIDNPPTQVLMLKDEMVVAESAEGEEPQKFSFSVSISGQEKMAEDGLTYVYPTGTSARLDFAISNESNMDMSSRVIRVYFAFDGDNYATGNYTPGTEYTLVNTATGSRYPMKVAKTEATGVYYYDISGFKPGDTLAFNNQFSYMSPSSGGGTMRIWAESISAEEAQQKEGKVSEPTNYILADWYTTPVPYEITKAVNGNPTFFFTANNKDENDDNIYVKNLAYQIKMTSTGASGTNNAKDYIKYVDMYDDMQLPEGMIWNPDFITAVQNHDYYYNTGNSTLYIKINDEWVVLTKLTVPSSSYVRSFDAEVVQDNNGNDAIRILWSYRNQYWSDSKTAPTADFPASTFTLYPGDLAIQIKRDSNLWNMVREGEEFTEEESDEMRRINNKVTETSVYSYSEPQTKEAMASPRLVYLTTGFSMTKTRLSGQSYFGMPYDFQISAINSGLTHKRDLDIMEDVLSETFYIKPADMEKMFKAKWGEALHIDITSATLAHRPERTVYDIQGNEFNITYARDHGIDPMPYSGTAGVEDGAVSVITAKAKLSLYWNTDRSQIILEVKDDAGNIQQTYTVGENGDFSSVEEAFDAIGYVVGYYATYAVKWDLGNDYTLYKALLDGISVSSIDELTPEQIKQYEYVLRSGRTDTFLINATAKDTTMKLLTDEPERYHSSYISSSNTARAKDESGTQVGIATWNGNINRELTLSKWASANGATLSGGFKVPDNTVIDYSLSFTNSGGEYDVLPLTDHMDGTQVLLVPVRGNKRALFYEADEGIPLEEANLEIYNHKGIDYYILNRTGTYRGVNIDGRTTDSIEVTKRTGAVRTLIIWYYQNVTGYSQNASSVTRGITYKALTDSHLLGASAETEAGTVTNHALFNETWLGGRPAHRLYDSIGGENEAIQFSKWIVEDPEATRENLIRHSLVQNDNDVLYKMIITNTGDSEITLTGNRLYDALPTTDNCFEWSKDNVTNITYVGHNAEIETTDDSYWYIDAIQPTTNANTESRGLYYIHWTNDFSFKLGPKGEMWIYITIHFPGADDIDPLTGNPDNKWDNYIAKNNGGLITNTFWIDQRHSEVTHELVDIVEGVLQKGVLDTGLAKSGKFQSEGTRHYYQNGSNTDNGTAQEVSYYTVIYNSGNVRLYLDPLQDELPKGFHFRSLFKGIPKGAQTTSEYNTSSGTLGHYNSVTSLTTLESLTGNANYIPVATVTDENRENIVYKNANVYVSVVENDGGDQVTFSFGRQSNSDSYLRYDSELQKYYLNPGEAIRFGYNCTVQGLKHTDNIATNEIAMPVYDKYGLGVHVSDPEQINVDPPVYRDIAVNDGGCDLLTTEEEMNGFGHIKTQWVKNTTEWMSSNVSLQRLEAVPGVGKHVAGETYIPPTTVISNEGIYGTKYNSGDRNGTAYVGTVSRASIVNWDLRAYNEGGIGTNSLEDYWLIDTVDAPYQFTGNFFYDYYNANGTKMSSNSIPVFSLGGRSENDTTVKISTGQGSNTLVLDGTITVNGPAVQVDGGRASVQLLRDPETKNETIKIHLNDNYHRIPPNTYISMIAHTQYTSSDAVLSKQFYNHVQLEPTTDFDPSTVSQGKVLYRDDQGESIPYAIESGASVTMTAGYSSAARKQVTEIATPSNTAWSDQEKNYIMLPSKFSTFTYDLYVDLPEDDPTSKLVLIDALPEPGDHSPFVDRDMRDSEFIVHMLSENLGFQVDSIADCGRGTRRTLTDEEYKLEISTKTAFDTEDWEGVGRGTNWTEINVNNLSAADIELLESARSFRITIDDPSVVDDPANGLMGRNHQVHVKFNAELQYPEEADPGTMAANSFGYRYTVPIGATGMSTSLNAEPLVVKVMIPSVPYVIKDLKTPLNHYKATQSDINYQFLIYSGSAIADLNDITGKTDAEIAAILQENGRDVLITPISIASGSSTGRTPFLDAEHKWVYNSESGAYEETSDNWIWESGHKYTLIEYKYEANGYVFSNIQHSPLNNYTFTQNTENNTSIRVTNVWDKKGNLKVSKTVNGPSYDPERKFTFTIHMQDGRYPVYGTFNYIGTNMRNGTITFDDSGNASIQLKHDQAIEIKDIPDGYTYSVTEAEDVWYSQQSSNSSGKIVDKTTQEASFTNTRKDTTLSISKTVSGNFGNRQKKFRFEVYVIDEGRELSGPFTYRIEEDGDTISSGTLDFSDGVSYVDVYHGETAVIEGLPVGARYEVEETADSRVGYTVTSTNETGVLEESGALTAWQNKKDVSVPTAVEMATKEWKMFALLLVLFGLYLLKRKKYA